MAVSASSRASDRFIGGDVLSAFVVAVALVAVSTLVQVQFVQIPGYLLIAGSDLIQNPLLPGLTGWAYTVFLAVYLYGVAILAATLYRWARSSNDR
ncbi:MULTISPECIES: hypothetical protein [Halobacterium]|uniref:hypothetical protein n=1 Tax=Halobacterium TaxID=2239 RepID=UPI00073E1FB3|nr:MULTISPECIES: hypothetical protein [Halobacterium]MCG1002805.1 hypothetical protein [Halobacterium noricense]